MSSIRSLLAPGGPLARALPAYEHRPGQAAMAEAVETALRDDRIVLCEAGTGTGKTLAYLLPALLSGRKVIVSTATRALQDQIVFKDLPLLAAAFDLKPRVALLKGISNYLCKRRHQEFRASPEGLRPEHTRSLDAIDAWVRQTETGDLAELAGMPEHDPVRLEVASSSQTRIGPSCEYHEECFVTRAKREADAAEVVVVNHHLFFADLALRGPHPARVLPEYDAVIFDEAHQLEDVATQFFSVRVSEAGMDRLLSDSERTLRRGGLADPLFGGEGGSSLLTLARKEVRSFFEKLLELASPDEARLALDGEVWTGELLRSYHALDSALEGVEALMQTAVGKLQGRSRPGRGQSDGLFVAARRTAQLREQLAAIVEAERDRVVWLEHGGRNIALSSTPVDLSWVLRSRLFDAIPAVVLTSATLATQGAQGGPSAGSEVTGSPHGAFDFVRARLGLTDHDSLEEMIVGSPFDFTRQALLYTPRDLPAPGTAEFWDAAGQRIVELIEITGGGAFVLTTSLRAMRELHARILQILKGRPVLLQGESPKNSLIGRFRAAGDAVLVATQGFWEGVDVPGQALRLVVLEKIPFPVPTDPIVKARSRILEEQGRSAFRELHVPTAALALKQGFGRLVRTEQDAGIVALLDERVHRMSYGRRLLAALPPAQRTSELGDVRHFYQTLARERGVF